MLNCLIVNIMNSVGIKIKIQPLHSGLNLTKICNIWNVWTVLDIWPFHFSIIRNFFSEFHYRFSFLFLYAILQLILDTV